MKRHSHLSREINGVLNEGTANKHLFRPLVSLLALTNIGVLFLSSMQEFEQLTVLFYIITYFSGVIFLIEYAARIAIAPLDHPHDKYPRLKYLCSFTGLVDFIAILPFVVPLLFPDSPELKEVIDFSRLFLVFKLTRYSRSFKMLSDVLREARPKLLVGFILASVIISFSAMIMYYIERDAQPDVFANIGDGYWWAVITFATVGYGDAVPITAMGKVLATIISIVGISMFALPTAIFSSTLIEHMNRQSRKKENPSPKEHPEKDGDAEPFIYCPYCGKKLSDHEKQPLPETAADSTK